MLMVKHQKPLDYTHFTGHKYSKSLYLHLVLIGGNISDVTAQ